MDVAVLVVGDEILDGSTTDTNSGWICRQIQGRGASVVRTAVVSDDAAEIAAGLDFLLASNPRLVITLGGLGPTRDDLTVAAVASHFGLPLEQNTRAAAIVAERYAALAAQGRVTDQAGPDALRARATMADLPVGAHALDNQVGAAPGVWLDRDGLSVLCLPGVPSELKWIVAHEAGARLQDALGTGCFRSVTLVTSTNDESELSGLLAAFDAAHGDLRVYVKSRARTFGPDVRMQVTISARGASEGEVTSRVDAAIEAFRDGLEASSVEVLSVAFDE